MKQPSEELLDQWDSQYGDRYRIVPVPEVSSDFEIYARAMDLKEYREFFNASITGNDAEKRNAANLAMHRSALYPTRSEITKAAGILAGLPRRVCNALQEMAGCVVEIWRTFDSVTDEELDELGIPREDAADLRSKYPAPGQLSLCQMQELGVVLVVRRPSPTCVARAQERIKEYFDAATDAAIECTVWPAPEKALAIYREHFAVAPQVVMPKLVDLAKGEASAVAKKPARRGNRSAT